MTATQEEALARELAGRVGERVTVVTSDLFNEERVDQGTIVGEPTKHGVRLPSGGWALYKKPGCSDAYFVQLRRKRKRNAWYLSCDRILRWWPGWGPEPARGEEKP